MLALFGYWQAHACDLLENRGSRVATSHTQVNNKGNESPVDDSLCNIGNLRIRYEQHVAMVTLTQLPCREYPW